MFGYIVQRTTQLLVVLFVVSVLVFLMMRLVPGDVALVMLGADATPEQVEDLRRILGLDRPPHEEIVSWFSNVLRGDLGVSIVSRRPVAESLLHRLPVTLSLTLGATLISAAIGVPAGVIGAYRQNTWWDKFITSASLVGLCLPGFWLGVLMILFFSVLWRWFPLGGYVPLTEDVVGWLYHLTLPALALGLIEAGSVTRMTRATLVEIIRADYVRTARAKGLSEPRVMMKHALKNATLPIVTTIGLNIGVLLAGTVAIETVFGLAGVGRYILDSVLNRDYPAVQGGILFLAAMHVLINLLVDISYALLDPRIRYE